MWYKTGRFIKVEPDGDVPFRDFNTFNLHYVARVQMINYLRNSIRRKVARRITKEYPVDIETFITEQYGPVRFANWGNPLVERKEINDRFLNFFRQFIGEGDFAIDIGANIGHMTVPMSVICGKKGLVLAVDPNPFVFRILSVNAELNSGSTNIHPINVAITDTVGDYYYNSSDAAFTNGGISNDPVNRHGKYSLSRKIKGIILGELLENQFADRLPRLKLIKIDTEGYDKEIIKSISNLLVQYKPVVISECFGKSSPADRFEHFAVLSSIGYSLFHIGGFDAGTQAVPILKPEDMLRWKHFDFIATTSAE